MFCYAIQIYYLIPFVGQSFKGIFLTFELTFELFGQPPDFTGSKQNQPQLLSWGLDKIKGKRLIHARSKENGRCMSRKMKC